MTRRSLSRIFKSDWMLVLLSAAVLLAYLYYTVSLIFNVPHPGFDMANTDDGWLVIETSQPNILINDLIIRIEDITYDEYLDDRLLVLLDGYSPGDIVSEIETIDGRVESVQMPEPGLELRLFNFITTIWFFPFWAAGTAVLLFVRPRDIRWRLLIAFMYLTGLWAFLGPVSNWHIGGSKVVLGVVTWFMVPVFLHLHLTVPSPLFERKQKILLPILYIIAAALAVLEIYQVPPLSAALMALVAVIMISVSLLLYRSLASASTKSDRMATRLMLAGIALTFGPGILVVFVPSLLGFESPNNVGIVLAYIALPVLPLSYTYAIYKRQLGAVEFRTNRLLSWYSLILLLPTLFILFLLIGEQWISSSAGRTFYLLIVSIAFALVSPPLLNRFQNILNKLAYGTEHDPDDILRVFAKEIPSALTRDALQELITQKITPSLLIRQSALYLTSNGDVETLYECNVPQLTRLTKKSQLDTLLIGAGTYRVPEMGTDGNFEWVRLVLSLVSRDEIKGIWLLGRRDPDDFYPRNDIDLLQTLTNQIAPVIENIELYEALQLHADSLAEEVANRTSELIEEKDRTQAILDSAGEGIFFTDAVGTILYTNPAMARLSGYETDAHIGKTLNLWQAEGKDSEKYRELWEAIYDGQGWGGELQLRCEDGTLKTVNLTIAPIQSQDGYLTGFVGVQSDISKMKEVDRLKSNIISSVSHEMKTPLTTMKTYIVLLEKGKKEKRELYFSILNRETDRLTAIIEDLLDLSSLEAGEIKSSPQPINTMKVVDEVITSSMNRADSKHIELLWQKNGDLPRVIADSTQLEQILSNLVVNAINYTPDGGRVILNAGQGQLKGEPAVWLQVSDTGPGIVEDEMPFLFDRFYRGQAAKNSGAPGTGLGLTICQELLERNGGKIEVKNHPKGGAAFTVWLPVETSEESPNGESELLVSTRTA